MRNRTAPLVLLAALLVTVLAGCSAETSPPLGADSERSQPAPEQSATTPQTELSTAQEPDADVEAAPQSETTEAPRTVAGTVLRVVDGDTAHISMNGAREKVRFIGIDTPESTREIEPFGKEASAYTKAALPVGRKVWLQTDAELRDRYGRLLAYVWLEKPQSDSDAEIRAKMLNAQIALDGYAQQMTIPPNVAYAENFRVYVREARAAGRGLWSSEESSLDGDESGAAAGIGTVAGDGEGSSAVVYLTRTGEKYHRADCSSLARSKIEVTLGDAIERGYEPCKRCEPPR